MAGLARVVSDTTFTPFTTFAGPGSESVNPDPHSPAVMLPSGLTVSAAEGSALVRLWQRRGGGGDRVSRRSELLDEMFCRIPKRISDSFNLVLTQEAHVMIFMNIPPFNEGVVVNV